MGDRANVKVISNAYGDVYLYTNWGGTELPEILQKALLRRKRWDDAQYLARIIFDAMTDGDQGSETGAGISGKVGDGDDRVLTVDVDKQTISDGKRTWTFQEYVDSKTLSWELGD